MDYADGWYKSALLKPMEYVFATIFLKHSFHVASDGIIFI